MSNSIRILIIIVYSLLNILNNVYAQNSFVDLILGDMYGKTRQEVYEYLKSFSIKNVNDEYLMIEVIKFDNNKILVTLLIIFILYLLL